MPVQNRTPLHGLTAAVHTPFDADGALNLAVVEKQAAHLLRNRISTVFIGGTTGESHSLRVEERRQLAERWCQVARTAPLRVVVHVGSNCLAEAKELAAQAQRLGLPAIAALAPSYFKPRDLAGLIDWCAEVAAAAPERPFYYYDIPVMTHAAFSMPEFLERSSGRIPTLAGIKFSHNDLVAYQLCLSLNAGAFDVPWGIDECLLAALALGARGAVGSTYNFAAPIYHRLLAAVDRGDLPAARREQLRSVQLVKVLASYGYMAAAKALMQTLGVEVGPARPPHNHLAPEQVRQLRADLEKLGFFDWVQS